MSLVDKIIKYTFDTALTNESSIDVDVILLQISIFNLEANKHMKSYLFVAENIFRRNIINYFLKTFLNVIAAFVHLQFLTEGHTINITL